MNDRSSKPAGVSLARAPWTATLAWSLAQGAARGKSIEEVFHDMAVVQGEDPNGFTLMVVSIALLITMATTLMVVTAMYLYKPRPKKIDSMSAPTSDASKSTGDDKTP